MNYKQMMIVDTIMVKFVRSVGKLFVAQAMSEDDKYKKKNEKERKKKR